MDSVIEDNLELWMLLNNKEVGFNYRQPRHEPWRINYELYRDKVTINRLLQRQSVNIPLMKTTLRTLLKDIDDLPVIEFENLDNDEEAEVFQNEYWKLTLECNNAVIQDIVDKKQDFFYGRTFDSWQVEDGKIIFDIEDPEDILVDRFMNPYDIDSSRFLIHTHIFVPLSDLKKNPDYDKEEIKDLEEFFKTKLGIIKAQDNQNSLQQKNKKMADLGVTDIEDPVLGETIVELTMHRVFRDGGEKWTDNATGKTHTEAEEQIFSYIEAENMVILMKKPQEKIIGVTEDHYWRNHFNYNTWGDDIDKQDFWTDGVADIVRVPNVVLNTFFSQEVERRTLNNLGMHYYDAALKEDGFAPSTFNPIAWGWYPIPTGGKKLSDVFQKVEMQGDPSDTQYNEYITEFTNKATGATDTQQGAVSANERTLGEVQLAQNEAKARTKGMSKFYTRAWEQRAYKFLKLIEAAQDKLDAVKIYKKGKNTDKLYEREISPKDWMTKAGYRVKVWSQDEKKAKDTESLDKLNAAMEIMFDNPKLREIYERKLLEFSDLTPDEITEVMDFEEKKMALVATGQIPPPQPPMQPGQTQKPQQTQQQGAYQ